MHNNLHKQVINLSHMYFVVAQFVECPRRILSPVHTNEGTTTRRNEVNGYDVPIFAKNVAELLLVDQLREKKLI